MRILRESEVQKIYINLESQNEDELEEILKKAIYDYRLYTEM